MSSGEASTDECLLLRLQLMNVFDWSQPRRDVRCSCPEGVGDILKLIEKSNAMMVLRAQSTLSGSSKRFVLLRISGIKDRPSPWHRHFQDHNATAIPWCQLKDRPRHQALQTKQFFTQVKVICFLQCHGGGLFESQH